MFVFRWILSIILFLIAKHTGVDNQFTDPQIHTMNGKGFGMGNLGQTGYVLHLIDQSI